jgi:hypothetical protein
VRVPTSDPHTINACWFLFLLFAYLLVAEAASFGKKELCRSDTLTKLNISTNSDGIFITITGSLITPVLRIRIFHPGSRIQGQKGNGSRIRIRNKEFEDFFLLSYSVADPGSGAFLTPGSGSRNRFFPDPGFQTHILESLVTIFLGKGL